MKKFLLYLLFFVIVAVSGFTFSPYASQLIRNVGLIGEKVPISGTGSMYPTFPKSEGVTEESAAKQTVAQPVMKRYPLGFNLFSIKLLSYQLQRGDIVEFENQLTRHITKEKYQEETGFVKRLIALPGDQIELKDGYVYLNKNILTEPYTAKPRSTYGGELAPDCQTIKIPDDSVFVLGDNRKASLDSRHNLGFVKLNDIHHVLPLKDQKVYQTNWRDTSTDLQFAHTTTTDPESFVSLLNQKRIAKHLNSLKLNPFLNKSSSIRGEVILDTDDFSIEATKSGLTLAKAVKQAGYRNIIFAELFTRGFYEANELLENSFEFPDTTKLLLSDEYQDIGLSAVLSDIRNCPTQVIVIHLGGYKPPNYDNEDVASWQKLIDNLTEILLSWEKIKGAEGIDQDKFNRLLNVLQQRLTNARRIYDRLSNNQWLTDEENELVKQDKDLHQEAEKLISELNK